jgi:hypothetical protein
MSKPKIERVTVTPSRLLSELERAQVALAHGDHGTAQRSLDYAVERLQVVRQAQDVGLDEATHTREARGQRVVPPAGGESVEA